MPVSAILEVAIAARSLGEVKESTPFQNETNKPLQIWKYLSDALANITRAEAAMIPTLKTSSSLRSLLKLLNCFTIT